MVTLRLSTFAAFAAAAAPCQTTQFLERLPFSGRTSTLSIATGDFDHDGDIDVLCSETNGLRLLLNDGTGRFTSVTQTTTTGHNYIATGDVDGDGDLDAVLGGRSSVLFRNDRTGTLRLEQTGAAGVFAGGGTLADLDGDGDLDSIWNGVLGGFEVALNVGGSGGYSPAPAFLPPGLPTVPVHSFAVADFNGDGHDDVYATGAAQLFLLSSATGVAPASTATIPPAALAVAGDVNGDGKADLVLASGSPNTANGVLFGDGDGSFQLSTTAIPELAVGDFALGDLDDDGDLDLAVTNESLLGVPTVRILLNDGSGVFTEAPSRVPQNGRVGRRLALADLDGDRDLDIYIGASRLVLFPEQDSIAINRHRQIETSGPAILGSDLSITCTSEPGYGSGIDLVLPVVGIESMPVLTPFGELHVGAVGAVSLPLVALSYPSGIGELNVSIPNRPSLIGADFVLQALVVDLFAVDPPRLTNFERFEIR